MKEEEQEESKRYYLTGDGDTLNLHSGRNSQDSRTFSGHAFQETLFSGHAARYGIFYAFGGRFACWQGSPGVRPCFRSSLLCLFGRGGVLPPGKIQEDVTPFPILFRMCFL